MEKLFVTGLMSGTSLDGIDAALVEIDENLSCKFIDGVSLDYSKKMQDKIKKLFEDKISTKFLCEMNVLIGEYFAKCALKLEEKTGKKPDLIGSHGVTLWHNPTKETFENMPLNSTMQIGEGAVIAERTGVTTVCDFRPDDMACGGQGAPLVPFADKIFFNKDDKSRVILNLGGIANVTVLSKNCEIFAFDTGPANMLIDNAMRKFYNKPFDKNGEIAKSGTVNQDLLNKLMSNEYFNLTPPKSTGREMFGEKYLENILSDINEKNENIIATLTMFTVKTIKDAFDKFIFQKTNVDEIVLGGGGAYNPEIIRLLENEFLPETLIRTHEDFGISNKFKEAIAFALLAYCTYKGIPNNVKSATGATKDTVLGKIIVK
ncbi:MAG: anhydro-N-acetylmuramic acid kinase [Candidatus Gastranaerophilales bacterium]|nr:anhydro-N-acetylmuramic acid kinase [Candidatus Gastranaerophilales bacterium]